MADIPASPQRATGGFASDEDGTRVDVPVRAWSPVFGPTQSLQLGADVPDRGIASPPGAVTQGWVGACSYQLADLAALRSGSGRAPDESLQAAAEALVAARDMDPTGQAVTGGGHARGTDFNSSPVARPVGRPTPPG